MTERGEGNSNFEQWDASRVCLETIEAILMHGTYIRDQHREVTDYTYKTDKIQIDINRGVGYMPYDTDSYTNVGIDYEDADGATVREWYRFETSEGVPMKTLFAGKNSTAQPVSPEDIEELASLLTLVKQYVDSVI